MLCQFVRSVERAVLSDCFHHLPFLSLANDINATLGYSVLRDDPNWLDYHTELKPGGVFVPRPLKFHPAFCEACDTLSSFKFPAQNLDACEGKP